MIRISPDVPPLGTHPKWPLLVVPEEVKDLFARVNRLTGLASERHDEGVALYREKIHPQIEHEPGFAGGMLLTGREAGVAYAITFWDSRDAMTESTEAGRKLADTAAEQLEAELTVEMLEVMFSKLPALTA